MATTVGDLFVRLGVDASELTSGFTAAEKKLEKFGTQLFFLGSRTTAGVTLPITAAVGAISTLGLGFDKAMSESLAIIKTATPQIRAELEQTAMAVSESTKFSSTQAAEGYYHLVSAGIQASEVLKGALPVAARFAQAGMMDMAKSTEFLAGAQAAMSTGLESGTQKVADMAKIADVLTEANNRALGTIEDFANALTNRAGAALRQSNKSVEEGVAVLAAFAEQNIKGKAAGQQLWMVIRDLGTYALKNADAFKKHQIAVYDNNGAMRNMADIIADIERATSKLSDAQKAQMFTELGIPLRSVAATKALLGYSDAIRAHQTALENAGGATKIVADNQMLALQNRVLQLTHEFQNAAIEIFKGFVPTIETYIVPAVRGALNIFKELGSFVSSLPEPVKAVAVALTIAAAAAGPLITLLGSMTLLASSALRGVSLLTGGIAAFSSTVGTAAGGVAAGARAMDLMAIASTGANTALGLIGGSAKVVVLNQSQLKEAMNLAAAAATAGAQAMGFNAIKAAEMGVEAKIAVANANRLAIGQQAVNAAMTAGATSTGLAARALAFMTNPITLIVGGLTLAAGAWYLYTKRQEAARQAVIDHMGEFQKQTREMDTALEVWARFGTVQTHNIQVNTAVAGAVKTLSDASGLSATAFMREATESNKLTDALGKQMRARQELIGSIRNDLMNDVLAAKTRVTELQARIASVMGGTQQVTYGAKGETFTRDMSIDERKHQIADLTAQLDRAKQSADDAGAAFRKAFGGASGITGGGEGANLAANQGRPLILMTPQERKKKYDEYMADVLDPSRHFTSDQIQGAKAAWEKLMADVTTPGGPATGEDANSPAKRLKAQIDEMKATITGSGGKELTTMLTAWHDLMASTGGKIAADPTAVDNLWQAYSKLRGELHQTVPEFEALFAEQLKQIQVNDDVKNNFNEYYNTWSDGMMKMTGDIGKISVAMLDFGKADFDRFFQANESTIKDLIPYYEQLEPAVRVLIDRYQEWAQSTDAATAKLSENASKASAAISEYAAAAGAKLSDARDQLELFSSKYADREIVALRKGIAQQQNESDKGYRKALAALAAAGKGMTAAETKTQLTILNNAKAAADERLRIEERIGLLRVAQGVGVGDNILLNEKKLTDNMLKEIIRRQDILNRRVSASQAAIRTLGDVGNIATSLGFDQAGAAIGKLTGGLNTLVSGLTLAKKQGASAADKMNGYVQAAAGAMDTWAQISDMGSRSARTASAALTGAQIGYMFGGLTGAAVGGIIGGLVGLFKGDPRWKKLQDMVSMETGTNITEGMAKGLEQAAKNITVDRSRLAPELAGRNSGIPGLAGISDKQIANLKAYHQQLGAVIADTGGLNASNFSQWTRTIATSFSLYHAGVLDANDMTMMLDQTWAGVVATGTKTSGVLARNATDLIRLAREAGVASKEMKAFVDAQLDVAAGGFNKLVGGLFGTGVQSEEDAAASVDKQEKIREKILKLQAQIADYETKGTNNEKQRVALLLARVHLNTANRELAKEEATQKVAEANVTRMAGPDGQEAFDRMARLGALTAQSMMAQGQSLFDILDKLGPALDTMSAARETFGLASSEAFNQLMKFRDFANVNPEIVAQIQGLTEMTLGLNNSAYITEGSFSDLAAQAADTMQKAQDAGLTQDEAYMAVQKTLQAIWEVQQDNNFALDEHTQKMLDDAVAAGVVGDKYKSSNDKMVDGISRLNQLFEAFLKHLGIDIPAAAGTAANTLVDEFNKVKPKVEVEVEYKERPFDWDKYKNDWNPKNQLPEPAPDPRQYEDNPDPLSLHDTGAIVQKPHVAMVHSGEAILPIHELWTQLDQRYRDDRNDGTAKSTVLNEGAVQVNITAPYYQSETEYLSKRVTRAVLDAIGNNDEPGYAKAIEEIVRREVDRIDAR